MIVAVLEVDLALLEAQSLKDKRRIIKGLKQRLHQKFNASVAEVEFQDLPRKCRLGVALVATDAGFAHAALDKMVDTMRNVAGATLVDYRRELL